MSVVTETALHGQKRTCTLNSRRNVYKTLSVRVVTCFGNSPVCDISTIATQTALDDGGARRQSGSQSHTDFDLAPCTS